MDPRGVCCSGQPLGVPTAAQAVVNVDHPRFPLLNDAQAPLNTSIRLLVVPDARCDLSILAVGTANGSIPSLCDGNSRPEVYLGTVLVRASADARGTFRLCLNDSNLRTDLIGPDFCFLLPGFVHSPIPIFPLATSCAEITVRPANCDTRLLVDRTTLPILDAHQPLEAETTQPAGLVAVSIQTDLGQSVCLSPNTLSLSFEPSVAGPKVSSVEHDDVSFATVHFSGPVPPRRLAHTDQAKRSHR